jgi:hypothetical protein
MLKSNIKVKIWEENRERRMFGLKIDKWNRHEMKIDLYEFKNKKI